MNRFAYISLCLFFLNPFVLAQAKTSQTISFGAAPAIAVNGTGSVSATATSKLAVSITSSTPKVCTVSGSTVTGVAAGLCTITANQAGNASYNAAPAATQSFNIAKANQTISFGAAPTLSLNQSGGLTVSSATGSVTASASSGLAVSLSTATPSVCSISGTTVTGVSVGTCTINANQAGNASYNAAAQATQSFSIAAVAAATNTPEIVQITPASTTSISLAWLPTAMGIPASQVSYAVYVATSNPFTPGPANLYATVVGKAQTTLSGLTAATRYYVLVIARDNKGNSIAGTNYALAPTLQVPVIKNTAVAVRTSDALGLGLATQNGNTLSFNKTASAKAPPVNSILLSHDRDGYQLQKVNKVLVSASAINVTTSPAALSDALNQATVFNSMLLFDVGGTKSGALASATHKAQRQSATVANGSRTHQISWDKGYLTAQQTDHAYQAPQLLVSPTAVANQHRIVMGQNAASASQAVTLQATVNFTPSLKTALDWSPASGIKYGTLMASGTLSVDLNAAYNFQGAASYNPAPVVLSSKTYTSVYLVGDIPVYQVVTLTISSKITASASAAIKAETDAKASETVMVGVIYNPATGQWQPVLNEGGSQSLTAQLNINGGVKAEVRLIPEVKVEFYKVVSGTLSVEPYLDGNIQATQISSDPVVLAALAPAVMEPSQFDINLGVQGNISINMNALWRNIKLLPKTTVDQITSPLFSLPSLQLQSIDSTTLELRQAQRLTLNVTNGINDKFDPASMQWQVIPAAAASITSQGCASNDFGYTCTASMTPQKAGKFNVLASGYGTLGAVARQYAITAASVVACQEGGKGPAGGIIFYCDSVGQHGLEAAPVDQASSTWGCWGWDNNLQQLTWKTVGSTDTAFGTGAANTAAIIAACGKSGGAGNGNTHGLGTASNAAATAAAYTLNGYHDWYLPSDAELSYFIGRIGGINGNYYWSSSEGDDGDGVALTNSQQEGKYYTLAVRAVRAF